MCSLFVAAALFATACSSSHGTTIDASVISDTGSNGDDGAPPQHDAPPTADAPCTTCVPLVTEWEHHFGGPSFGNYVTSVATDADGNSYIAGFFATAIDLGGGYTFTPAAVTPPPPQPSADILVASYRGDGTIRWAIQVGGTDTDQASGIYVRGGKVYVAASFAGTITVDGDQFTATATSGSSFPRSDSLILVLDAADGHHLGHTHYGMPNDDDALSIAADAAGNITVCGDFPTGTLAFDASHQVTAAGTDNAYIASFTASFAPRWSRALAGSAPVPPATGSYNSAQQLGIDAAGNVTVVGEWMGTTNFGAGTVVSTDAAHYDFDAFVASYTSDGTPRWSRIYGGGQGDTANTVGVSPAGDVAVGGGFHGTVDFGNGTTPLHQTATYIDGFGLLLDGATGNTIIARSVDDDTSSAIRAVRIDSHGDLVVAGEVEGASTDLGNGIVLASAAGGEQDMFVAGYARATGHTTFGQRWGGAGHASTYADARTLALTVNDSMVVGGVLSGPVDLGDGPIANATRDMGYVMLVPR